MLFFPKFAPELRNMILQAAIPKHQEIIVLEAHRTPKVNGMRYIIFRYLGTKKPHPLLAVSRETRAAVTQYQNTETRPTLSGFKGIIHINGDKDLVVLKGYTEAFVTGAMLSGVKSVVMDFWWPEFHDIRFAQKLKEMFPDLRHYYVINREKESRYLGSYVRHPDLFELVPMAAVSY
jgi:2EXR family